MWAQDATAMYGYAGASAAATQLTPFNSAPQTSNPAASSTQAAATASSTSANAVSSASGTGGLVQFLEDFLNSPFIQDFETISNLSAGYLGGISGLTYTASGVGFVVSPFVSTALIPAAAAAQALYAPAAAAPVSDVTGGALGAALLGPSGSAASASGSAGLAGAEVSAGLGRAASVGGLSVPQTWGSAAPEIRLAAKTLPMAGLDGLPAAATAGPGGFSGGMPMGPIGSVVNAPRTGVPASRNMARPQVMAQLPGESTSGGGDRTLGQSLPPDRRAEVLSALSERERGELEELRNELAELEMERDAAARLIKEAIRP
jgi:PPE-repeat protein